METMERTIHALSTDTMTGEIIHTTIEERKDGLELNSYHAKEILSMVHRAEWSILSHNLTPEDLELEIQNFVQSFEVLTDTRNPGARVLVFIRNDARIGDSDFMQVLTICIM